MRRTTGSAPTPRRRPGREMRYLSCFYARFLQRLDRGMNQLLPRPRVHRFASCLHLTGDDLEAASAQVRHAIKATRLQNDILEAKNSELCAQNANLNAALNSMSLALCMADAEHKLIVHNLRFLQLFGLHPGLARPGTATSDVFRAIIASGQHDQRLIESIHIEQRLLAVARSAGKILQEDDAGRALAVSQQPLDDGGWVATYEDISERRRAEADIRFLAYHDSLTNLPNRLLFRVRLEAALKALRPHSGALALLYLDIDHFKDINDTLGHPAGDMLLEAVARRLRNCVRGNDLVARLGGDEFAILQFAISDPSETAKLAGRIADISNQPFFICGRPAIVSVSIGIATAMDSHTSADLLLKNADMALYRAKAEGRGTWRFFE